MAKNDERHDSILHAYHRALEGRSPGNLAAADLFSSIKKQIPDVTPEEIFAVLNADLECERSDLERARRAYERSRREADHMAKWASAERAKGRPESELTWGNCVRETGILRPRGGDDPAAK